MGELYRLCDFYRARGAAFSHPRAPDARALEARASEAKAGAERAASREQGLWVIAFALLLVLAVIAVFSFAGPQSVEEAGNGPTNLHVALTQAER